jgi:hypothetical protein
MFALRDPTSTSVPSPFLLPDVSDRNLKPLLPFAIIYLDYIYYKSYFFQFY